MFSVLFRNLFCYRPCASLCLVLMVLSTLFLPTPAAANCLHIRPPYGEQGDVDPGDGLVLRIAPDREDLWVTVQWSLAARRLATFVLSTPTGEELMSWMVPRTPGEVSEHRLSKALSQITNLGFQYRLHLANPDGTTSGVSFRVAADCPPDGLCTYQLLPGLEGSLTVSHALWSALDEARVAGSTDLLADVQAQHPELAPEVPGFGWQLQTAEPVANADCRCRWLTVEGLAPKKPLEIGNLNTTPPLQDYGENLEGAAFYGLLQGTAGTVTMSRPQLVGQTTFGLQLLCTRDLGESAARFPTSWPSLPELEIAQRQLETCPAPCTPMIEYTSTVWGCAQATATSRNGNDAEAAAEIDVSLALGSQSLIAWAALVEADVASGQTVRDLESLWKQSSAELYTEGAVATMVAGGEQSIAVEALGGARTSYALTSMSTKYKMKFVGSASCEGIPQDEASVGNLHDGTHEGGVAIEQWEDP